MKKNVLIALGLLTFSGVYAQENEKEQDSLKNNELSEVTIVGSRSKNRVKTDVPVPVDVFNISDITNNDAPIYTSMHGNGEWEFEKYSDSFVDFLKDIVE